MKKPFHYDFNWYVSGVRHKPKFPVTILETFLNFAPLTMIGGEKKSVHSAAQQPMITRLTLSMCVDLFFMVPKIR